jgi:hypothetical protein
VGRQVRRAALVVLMIFAALVAPIALPIRIIVLHLKRETPKTEFVVRHVSPGDMLEPLPETV